jgi:DNA polymerase elongation subunit (family B)
MTYNISPETLLLNDDGSEDIIRTPLEGVYYRRKEGILPAVTKAVFDERKMFKLKQRILEAKHKKMSVERISKSFSVNIELIKKYCEEIEVEQGTIDFYKMGQAVRKRIANSMYGVLGNPYFHFYNIYNAKAVTVAGQALIKYLYTNVDNYFLNKFHIDYKCEKVEGNVVICVDTDSCYICLDEVAKKLKVDVSTSEKLLEWQNELDKKLMKPFFINILNDYADGYKVKQLFNFKREKAITRMMILGKKRYVAEYIYNEGIAYEEPQMTFVGVEVVRSSSPAYCRKYMKETIKQIFKETDSKKIIDKIIEVKEGFYKQPIDQISSPRNINDYGKYSESTDYYIKNGLSFKKGCPIHNRAAICYNYLIKKYNLPLQPVFSGTKIKFIYVNKNNELNSNIVGFIGNWPKEFNEIFRIDFENQFAKSYTNTIQQFFSVLGWGTINLDQCTIDETVQW